MTTTESAPAAVQVGEPNGHGEASIRCPVLVLESVETSDGRYLMPDSLSARAFPISLLAVAESAHGGNEPAAAVIVGKLTGAKRVPGPEVVSKRTKQPFPDDAYVWVAEGMISTTAEVPVGNRSENAYELVRTGRLRGISVDLAGMDYEVVDENTFDAAHPRRQLIVHSAEIAAATLVPIPAFSDAYVELGDDAAEFEPLEGLAASAAPAWRSSEVGDYAPHPAITAAADEGMPVRIPADSVEQLAAVIDSGEQRDAPTLATAIVEHIAQNWAATEPITEDELPEDGKMAAKTDEPPADEIATDDSLEDEGDPAAPQACIYSEPGNDHPATMSLLYQDGDQFVSVCADDEQRARDELEKAGETVSDVVAIGGGEEPPAEEPVVAAAVTDVFLDEVLPANNATRARPPLAWFEDPGLTEKTPITIEGQRVYGHIAPWDEPHIGFNGQKIYVPKSRTDYKYFRYGGIRADDNGVARIVAVGHLTIATGHADMHLGVEDTKRHYDHSGYSWAKVAVGEDKFGVWVAGVLSPGITDEQIEAALAHPPSGDWRPVKEGGIELCAALSVNVPGFGITRARVASGQVQALVAGGQMQPRRIGHEPVDIGALADAIVERMDAAGRAVEHAQLVAQLDDTPTVVAALLAEVDDSPVRMAALFAELEPSDHDHAFGVLDEKPGSNWIEQLPAPLRAAWDKSIVYRAATHMHQERGMEVGHAIASALNWAKVVCSSGDVKQWKGPQSVNPKSRAECCEAIALWETMRAAAKADN